MSPFTITMSAQRVHGKFHFCVTYHASRVRQLMAFYPLTIGGFLRARAYTREMRIVYGVLDAHGKVA